MATCLGSVFAYPTSGSHKLFERAKTGFSQWEKRDKASPEAVIPITIALTQSNMTQGSEWLLDISDPNSPNFGKHMTAKQVQDAFAPTMETKSSVRTWLANAGISENKVTFSASAGYLKFDATVSQAESLLKTEFHVYQNKNSGKQHFGCENYHLPSHLVANIDFIKPTINSPRSFNKRTARTRSAIERRDAKASCANSVGPDCIKS